MAKKLRAARKEAQRKRIEEKQRRRKTKGRGGQPEAERKPPATQNTDLDLGFFWVLRDGREEKGGRERKLFSP